MITNLRSSSLLNRLSLSVPQELCREQGKCRGKLEEMLTVGLPFIRIPSFNKLHQINTNLDLLLIQVKLVLTDRHGPHCLG